MDLKDLFIGTIIKLLINKGTNIQELLSASFQGVKRLFVLAYVIPQNIVNAEFNGVYSRDNLPKKLKDGVYVINFDEYTDSGTHWIALYLLNIEIIYFDSFGIEHVPKEVKEFIGHKNIKANIQNTSRQFDIAWMFLH